MANQLYFRNLSSNVFSVSGNTQFQFLSETNGTSQGQLTVGASSNAVESLWTVTNAGAKRIWITEPLSAPVTFTDDITLTIASARESAAAANVSAGCRLGKMDIYGNITYFTWDTGDPYIRTTEFPSLSPAARSVVGTINGMTAGTKERIVAEIVVHQPSDFTILALSGTRTANFFYNGSAATNNTNILFTDNLAFMRRNHVVS